MSETLIKVENVSKKFCRSLKTSLWYGMKDLGSELIGRPHGGNGALRPGEFWAVDDVSFEVKRGECLGLIGRNGAGKSTLLRMLNGLIKPDRGRVTTRGRVGALIALGAGFNPLLTGKENVYVAGAVLGLKTKEIAGKYDEIVEFSELADFMDSPVQSYSSGMQVRLGFAVAAHTEPDILILDEVLAVGDMGFRTKCYNRVFELAKRSAVIFVSHQMSQVARLCPESLLLESGRLLRQDKTSLLVSDYEKQFPRAGSSWSIAEGVTLSSVTVNDIADQETIRINAGDPLVVKVTLTLPPGFRCLEASLSIHHPSLEIISHINSKQTGAALAVTGRECQIAIEVPSLTLGNGRKLLTLVLRDGDSSEILLWANAVWELQVESPYMVPAPVYHEARFSIGTSETLTVA